MEGLQCGVVVSPEEVANVFSNRAAIRFDLQRLRGARDGLR